MNNFLILKVAVFGVCLHATTSTAQNPMMGGPQIMDALPQGAIMGRTGQLNGPRSPAFFRAIGGGNSNWIQSMTSGSAIFDNGTILAGIGADAGFGTVGARWGSRLQTGFQSGPQMREGWKIGLGPMTLSNFTGGLGAFYTDYNSPQGIGDASGWSSVITMSSTVYLNLPWLSLGGQISGYYLPFVDKWGYGTPSPLLSFGAQFGQIAPGGSIGLGIKGSLAGWKWIVYDGFNASYGGTNITDIIFDGSPVNSTYGSLSASLPSATAVDQVGRYQFGGGAFLDRPADATSRFQAPRFTNNGRSILSQDRSFFSNTIGTMVGTMLGSQVRNFYWIQRDDYWATTNFINRGNFIRGGAYADYQSGNPYLNPYIGYEFGTGDEFATVHHMVNTGSYGYLSPKTTYFANLGWVWGTGYPNSVSSALYEMVIFQAISNRLSHSLGGGRTVTDPTYGERYIADYLSYYLNFRLGMQSTIQAVAGMSETNGSLTGSGNANRTFQGIRFRTTLGQSNVSLSAIHENYDFKGGGPQQLDQWIYKALYGLPIGGYRSTAYTGYQYIDRRASGGLASFQEHLWLLYVSHQF